MNEMFFVCLYLNAYWTKPIYPAFPIPEFVSASLAAAQPKVFAYLVWGLRSATWPQVAGLISLPIMLAKQFINVVQFWKASKIVSSHSFF